MRAGVFGTTDYPTEASIAEGLRALGYAVEFQRPGVWTEDQARPYDLVVVRGLRPEFNSPKIRNHYRQRGAIVLVHDMPAIRKPGYFALWRDDVNTLPEDWDESRMDLVDLRDRNTSNGTKILVCGQVPNDAAHGMDRDRLTVYFAALVVRLQQKYPTKNVIWRPHPQANMDGAYWVERQDPEAVSFEDALADPDLFAVATYNSTCGIQALEAGVPVICDKTSFYAPLSGIPMPNGRADFFARLTHSQWTLDELKTAGPYLATIPAELAA